jgi:hypothetical protein
MKSKTLLALGAIALAGGSVAPGVLAGVEAAPNAAFKLAEAFAQAAEAEKKGDAKGLAKALRFIDASGARPLATSQADPIPAWRSLANGAGSPPYRGRPLGPGYRSGLLNPGGRETFNQLFLSGTGASIALSAPTGDRLALKVLDPQAKPICTDESGRGGMCRWIPLFTQRYTIEVSNMGKGDARYFLVVQ